MSGILSILIIAVCALLILIVLVQNSKGGGLSSSFAANNQIMGVRKTADFLEKATWGLAIALFVFSLLASPKRQVAEGEDTTTESVSKKKQEGMITVPSNVGNAPANAGNGAVQGGPAAGQQPAGGNAPANK